MSKQKMASGVRLLKDLHNATHYVLVATQCVRLGQPDGGTWNFASDVAAAGIVV
jgi:hypothetical protein